MDRLLAAKAFVAIVEHGSFVAAAEQLNMSRASASRCVTELENWTKAKLLHRSTRSLSLTPAGETMLQQCQKLLEISNDISVQNLSDLKTPVGTLRVSCSQYFAQYKILDLVDEFVELYPGVTVDLHISNQIVNLVEERIDLAIRITNNLDPNLIARKLGAVSSVLCASPHYLKAFGTPQRLEDLVHHNCLVYSNFEKTNWRFQLNGQPVSIAVSGNVGANESMVLLEMALRGRGITLQPLDVAREYVNAGALTPVLETCEPEKMEIHGVFLTRKNMSLAQRLFIDLLVDRLKK